MDKSTLVSYVKTVYRSEIQDNYITNVSDEDIDKAINLTIGHINRMKPSTNFDLDFFLKEKETSVWFNVLVNGAVYYLLVIQSDEWMHNGTDLQINEIHIDDRLSQYNDMKESFKEDFEEAVREIKGQFFTRNVKTVTSMNSSVGAYGSNSSRGRVLKKHYCLSSAIRRRK